jgi:hypothetical protein
MRKRFLAPLVLIGVTTLAFSFFGVSTAQGPSNDVLKIVGTSSSPAGHGQLAGSQQNWFVDTAVAPGGSFTVDISVSIDVNGNTTVYPRTVNLGQGSGGSGVLSAISDCVFADSTTICMRTVTVTVPNTDGGYTIKVDATGGTGNPFGLNKGNGLNIHYDVASGPPVCEPVATSLSVDALEAIYHQPSVTLSATLTQDSDGSGLAGKTIRFEVDGEPVGTGVTDSNGTATYEFATNALPVGDYTINAFYDGEECLFVESSGSASLCISYGSVTFKPPISPTGPALFRSVKTIPVKIVVTDYYGIVVPDADAHVFFAKYTSNTTTDLEAEADPLANTNGDNGNLMRYDATAGQYIFNWNTTGLTDGKYRIHIVLGEGSCAPQRTADVTFKRK